MRTVDIPDGQATLRDPDELNVGQSRAVAKALRRIRKAAIDAPDVVDALGLPAEITEDDLDASWAAGDVMITAMLVSWTLDRPVPATLAEVSELPVPLYMALQTAVAATQTVDAPDPFSVDAVEDPDSPTGA